MGRQRCVGCERPVSVCLCSQLPSRPLQTRTCVVVLQHPHEARHKLSTLPILAKSLANCHVLRGRRFQQGCSPLLDFFFTHDPPAHHALLLFPTLSAQPISVWFAQHQSQDSCPCSTSIQVDSLCSAPHLMKECKSTSEDCDASCSPCQAIEVGASESNKKHSEAPPLQRDISSYVAYDSDCVLQQVDTLNHLHGHSDLPVCCPHDSPSRDAGHYNYGAQTADLKFKKMSSSMDVARPGKDAASSSTIINETHSSFCSSQQANASICSTKDANPCPHKPGFPDLVLIAIDATWQHANEMIRASGSYLNKFAIPVCLPFDTKQEGFGMANSELIIRKEPFKGCMTTLEAVASCLKVLEPNGAEIGVTPGGNVSIKEKIFRDWTLCGASYHAQRTSSDGDIMMEHLMMLEGRKL